MRHPVPRGAHPDGTRGHVVRAGAATASTARIDPARFKPRAGRTRHRVDA